MSRKAATTLAVLLVVGTSSAVLADANNRTDYQSSYGQRTTEKNASSAASQSALARRVLFRRGTAGKPSVWIKLTEPGGNPTHINLEHVTSVRSATLIPKARAQLDLTSGKFQGVQESVDEVMRLIAAAPGPRENDEAPNAAL